MNLVPRTVPNGSIIPKFLRTSLMDGPSFRSGSPAAAPPLTAHGRREVVVVMISEDVAEVEVERRRPLQPRLRMEEGERERSRGRRLMDCKRK